MRFLSKGFTHLGFPAPIPMALGTIDASRSVSPFTVRDISALRVALLQDRTEKNWRSSKTGSLLSVRGSRSMTGSLSSRKRRLRKPRPQGDDLDAQSR